MSAITSTHCSLARHVMVAAEARSWNHRITDFPELEVPHKDYRVRLLSLHRTTPKFSSVGTVLLQGWGHSCIPPVPVGCRTGHSSSETVTHKHVGTAVTWRGCVCK